MAEPNSAIGTASEFSSTRTTCSPGKAARVPPARRLRSPSPAKVRPPSSGPIATRSASPSDAISRIIPTWTAGSSVRSGQRLGPPHVEQRLGHGERARPRLGAEHLHPGVLAAVALPDLGALVEAGSRLAGGTAAVGDVHHGLAAAAQVDVAGRPD